LQFKLLQTTKLIKAMNIEQKAKAYDEKLYIARCLIADPNVSDSDKFYIKDLFPEVIESEDERIRKELICFLNTEIPQCEARDKYTSWLEKQGEQSNNKVEPKFKDGDVLYSPCLKLLWIYKDENTCYVGSNLNYNSGSIAINKPVYIPTDVHPATKEQRDLLFAKMKEAGYEWLEETKELKKIEQKPAWTEGDEKQLNDIIELLPNLTNRHNWLKSLKDRVQPEQEWNEEDKKMLNSFLHKVEVCNLLSNKENVWIINKLKSLRPQPKQEWSEEDKKIINGITSYLCTHDSCELDGFNKWYDWLKSLKERITWKPSDEQMKQLGWIAEQNKDNMIGKELISLYQDLKKLREG